MFAFRTNIESPDRMERERMNKSVRVFRHRHMLNLKHTKNSNVVEINEDEAHIH